MNRAPDLEACAQQCTNLTCTSWSYFRMEAMNSRCFFSSSSCATACSDACSFCCVLASSSRSQAFSWHSRRTCVRSFCFSASTICRWAASAIITCATKQQPVIIQLVTTQPVKTNQHHLQMGCQRHHHLHHATTTGYNTTGYSNRSPLQVSCY